MNVRNTPEIAAFETLPPQPAGERLSGLTADMGLIPYLALVCRERREQAGLTQGRVGAALIYRTGSGGQNTITKFEALRPGGSGGDYQPQNLDAVVQSYAEEAKINALELWADALTRARADGVEQAHKLADELDQSRRSESRGSAPGRRSKKTRKAS